MPDPFNRIPGLAYRELMPGFLAFDCNALKAALSPSACADHWKECRYIHCAKCPIGKAHATAPEQALQPGQAPNPRKVKEPRQARNLGNLDPCVRCGRTRSRLIARVFCLSCYNRTREVVRGVNAKGRLPAVAGAQLHKAVAILRHPDAENALTELYRRRAVAGDYSSGLAQEHLPGTPYFEVLDDSHLRLSMVSTGRSEVQAVLARLLPDATVENMEIGESFAGRWKRLENG